MTWGYYIFHAIIHYLNINWLWHTSSVFKCLRLPQFIDYPILLIFTLPQYWMEIINSHNNVTICSLNWKHRSLNMFCPVFVTWMLYFQAFCLTSLTSRLQHSELNFKANEDEHHNIFIWTSWQSAVEIICIYLLAKKKMKWKWILLFFGV